MVGFIQIVEGDEVKEEVIDGSNLKIIASVRNDPNNISVPAATAKGIPVIAAPGRNTIAVAELTIALMLNQARKIIKAERLLKNDFMVDDFSDFGNMYKMTTGFELKVRLLESLGLVRLAWRLLNGSMHLE